MAHCTFYIGTYTMPILFGTGQVFEGKGKGVYRLEFDTDTERMALSPVAASSDNPSFLCFSPDRQFLYAVNELKTFRGMDSGSVSAYRIEPDGSLTFLNAQPTMGTDPCHVTVNAEQTFVFVSNFMSGSVCVLPIRSDGSLDSPSQFIQHTGSSINRKRQAGPHAHSLVFSPDSRFAFVPDLGIDRLVAYAVSAQSEPLSPVPSFSAFPGAGPRYCEFSPDGRFCYLINEIASSISVLEYHAGSGSFTCLQTASSVPADAGVESICADLHLSADGKHLYSSNRGHDSITHFAVDTQTGLLFLQSVTSCGGRVPRNFCLVHGAPYLLVGNQESDNIVLFRIEESTGALRQIGEIAVPSPVCIRQF